MSRSEQPVQYRGSQDIDDSHRQSLCIQYLLFDTEVTVISTVDFDYYRGRFLKITSPVTLQVCDKWRQHLASTEKRCRNFTPVGDIRVIKFTC